MTTVTEVANLALVHLGEPPLTDVLTEELKTARVLRSVEPVLRRAFLRDARWKFARTRITLNASATPPTGGYTNQYPVPADWLKLQFPSENELRFAMQGRMLLADGGDTLDVIYTRDLDTYGDWDSQAIKAFALEWAEATCLSITGDSGLKNQLAAQKEMSLSTAKAGDGSEQSIQVFDNDVWLRARRGYRGARFGS